MKGVELVLAEPAALLVAKRRGDLVSPEPGADARQVVLVDESQTVGLERTSEVDGNDSVEVIFLDIVHQDSERTVVAVGSEVERHFSVFELESFHDLKLVLGFFSEGIEGFIREDDVIEKLDIEDVTGSLEPLRLVDVGDTRDNRPTRVVVEEDDRRGVRQKGLLDDAPVVDRSGLQCPDNDHLLGQRELGRVEKEDPGLLVIEGPEVFLEEPGCLGRCGDGSVGCEVSLLFHSAAV